MFVIWVASTRKHRRTNVKNIEVYKKPVTNYEREWKRTVLELKRWSYEVERHVCHGDWWLLGIFPKILFLFSVKGKRKSRTQRHNFFVKTEFIYKNSLIVFCNLTKVNDLFRIFNDYKNSCASPNELHNKYNMLCKLLFQYETN